MDKLGYKGYVGLEYVPKPDTLSSLGWIKQMGCQLA
jgi:hydroxypyruvate isomerase